jgi:ADP-ribosylglycohydrolase
MAGWQDDRLTRAKRALEWLALGDAFGQTLFAPAFLIDPMLAERVNGFEGPWPYTDDAAMASAVHDELAASGSIDPASLADRFAAEYAREPWRGYGGGMHRLFERRGAGVDWEVAAHMLFEGSGSFGNGAAMRVAPLGAYFADADDATLVAQARQSALPTHTHHEGVAGAVAMCAPASTLPAVWLERAEPII